MPAHALDPIPRRDVSLTDNTEVEPGPPAQKEPVEDVLPPEPDPELEARETRVRRFEDRSAHAVLVSDVDITLNEALRRDVLPEHPPRQRHPGKLAGPERVVLARVGVYRLHRGPVDPWIPDRVSLEAGGPDANPARHGLLEDRRGHGPPLIRHPLREGDVDGDDSHSVRSSRRRPALSGIRGCPQVAPWEARCRGDRPA